MYDIMKYIISYCLTYITERFKKEKCIICFESISYKKSTKLSCGHRFHTDCIISWFRQKKNTCPCCRDTGIQNTIIQNTITQSDDNWESHPHVRVFLNSANPTKDQIVNAYYIRDINMNIGIQECFENCVKYLGIDPDSFESQIKQSFVMDRMSLYNIYIRNCLDNPHEIKTFSISIRYNEYLIEKLDSEIYKEKIHMYNILEKLRNENNHKGLYECLDIDNLHELGW